MLGVVRILRGEGVSFGNALRTGAVFGVRLELVDVDVGTVSGQLEDEGPSTVARQNPEVFRENPSAFDRVGLNLLSERAGVDGSLGSLVRGIVFALLGVGRGGFGIHVDIVFCTDTIVGDVIVRGGISGRHALPKEWAHEEVVPADSVVLLDDFGVHERHPEDDGQQGDDGRGSNDSTGHDSTWELIETQAGRALEDDRHGRHGTDEEEDEWGGVQGPTSGVFADENTELHHRVEDDGEASSDTGGDTKPSEDGRKTFSAVPSPVGSIEAACSNTNTEDRRDDRVGGRNGPRHSCGEREPARGSGDRANESQELNAWVSLEDGFRYDAILNCGGHTSTDQDSSEELHDSRCKTSLLQTERF